MRLRASTTWIRWSALVALGSVALGCSERPTPPDAALAASYRGGTVTVREVERALLRADGLGANGAGSEELLATYRDAAESTVVGRLLLGDEELAVMLAELGDDGRSIRRKVVVASYLGARLGDLRPRAEDVEALYAAHREELRRPAQRDVAHLFRRHRDPSRPEATIALLRELKARAEAGDGFSRLAQQYSDSETRVLGGRLGLLRAGRLPRELETEVFALPAGGISEPLPVPGGAALFFVSEVIEERDFSLEDVRSTIVTRLALDRRRARIAELLAGREPPPGATILDRDHLVAAFRGADPEQVVLSIGDDRLTVRELRELFDQAQPSPGAVLEPPPQERLELAYQDLVHEHLVFLAATEAEVGEAQRRELDDRIRQLAGEALVRRRLDDLVRRRAGDDEAALRRFFDDNHHLYQTPLRLEIRSLHVAAGPGAERTLAALEGARDELERGVVDFDAVAARVGGRVVNLGWVDFDTLMTYEPKVLYYLLELNGSGYTVPFQLNRQLNLMWVVARDEPREEPFEAVRERLVADYCDRHHQELRRAAVEALLEAEQFHFFGDNVRQALAPPAPARTPPGF